MKRTSHPAARPLFRALLASLLAVGLPAGATAAADAAPAGAPRAGSAISPEARAVMERMTATLRGLSNFRVDARVSRDELVSYGYKLQRQERSTLVVQRPDKLRAEISGDIRNRSFVYDGKQLWMHSADDQAFVRTPAANTLAQLLDNLIGAGIDMPMIDVLYQGANGNLAEAVRGGVWVGESSVDGVPCDQLAFRQAEVDWQIWVQKGEQALPRKIVITTRYEFGEPQFQAVMDWNLQPGIGAATFAFTAPRGAAEIPFQSPVDLAAGAGAQP